MNQTERPNTQPPPPQLPYQTNRFELRLYEGWQDKTVITLVGPVDDGIQHNVIVLFEDDSPFTTVRDFAEAQINALETELKSCRVLKKGGIALSNGLNAYQAIYSWYPAEHLQVYQEQVYVLSDKTAYKLTATFTKRTRKTLGPLVQRMMLSFNPVGHNRTGTPESQRQKA